VTATGGGVQEEAPVADKAAGPERPSQRADTGAAAEQTKIGEAGRANWGSGRERKWFGRRGRT
jgi:hypothetical protein